MIKSLIKHNFEVKTVRNVQFSAMYTLFGLFSPELKGSKVKPQYSSRLGSTFSNFKFSPALQVVFLSFFVASCNSENAFDCVKSEGKTESREIFVEDFNSIKVNDGIEVILEQGAEKKVVLRTGKNLMPKIKFEISDNELVISNKNTCNWIRSYGNLKVYITVDDLKKINQNGYGKISSSGKLIFPEFEIFNDGGNGDVDLELETQSLRLFCRSYSNITLKGTATSASVEYVYNHGKFLGQEFKVDHMSINHNGLNTLSIFPVKTLDFIINHSGDIECYNEPEEIKSTYNASGELIKKF